MSRLVTGKHTNKNTGRQQNRTLKQNYQQAALFLYMLTLIILKTSCLATSFKENLKASQLGIVNAVYKCCPSLVDWINGVLWIEREIKTNIMEDRWSFCSRGHKPLKPCTFQLPLPGCIIINIIISIIKKTIKNKTINCIVKKHNCCDISFIQKWSGRFSLTFKQISHSVGKLQFHSESIKC